MAPKVHHRGPETPSASDRQSDPFTDPIHGVLCRERRARRIDDIDVTPWADPLDSRVGGPYLCSVRHSIEKESQC